MRLPLRPTEPRPWAPLADAEWQALEPVIRSGGAPLLLAGTALRRRGGELQLRLVEGSGLFAGESVQRRLDALATALGLTATVEVAAG
jgi:hypothetical protein